MKNNNKFLMQKTKYWHEKKNVKISKKNIDIVISLLIVIDWSIEKKIV